MLGFLTGATRAADVSISIVEPAADFSAAESLPVRAVINSLYELSFVKASVGEHEANLVYSGSAAGGWTNSISLASLSWGPHTLIVTAQDVFGTSAQTQLVFKVDRPPTIAVQAPLNGTVHRGQVYVEATATDDDPAGVLIEVHAPYNPFRPTVQLRGTNRVSGLISPQSSYVAFVFRDSASHWLGLARNVILEPSSNLVEAATAPGTVLDLSANRLLYVLQDSTKFNNPGALEAAIMGYIGSASLLGPTQPQVLDRWSQQVYSAPPSTLTTKLTFGLLGFTAALLGFTNPPPVPVHNWSGWAVTNDDITFGGSPYGGAEIGGRRGIQVSGDSVAWVNYGAPSSSNLFLRDMVKTNEQLVIGAKVGFAGYHLAPNMDLVYESFSQIFRSRPATPAQPYVNRSTTQLTFGDSASSPVTDGTNVVFSRAISNSTVIHVVLFAPSGEETLAVWPNSGGGDYRAKNGWVAFTKPGSIGQAQIWTRSPPGEVRQRTFFNSSSTLESLGPKGEVTFLFSGGRYLSLAGAAPWWINSGQGMVRWQDERLLLLLGRSIFEVVMGYLSSSLLASGDVKMNFNGPQGIACTLQSSADLKDWSESLAFTNSSGTTSWTNPPSSTQRFHRTVTAIP